MLDWMSPLAFLQTLIRVTVVWSAFFSAGKLITSRTGLKRLLPLVPDEIVGMIFFILLVIPLSLFTALNRTVVPIILLCFALPGFFIIFHRLKINYLHDFSVFGLIKALVLLLVLTFVFTNASSPNLNFDDPLITYAVQPDNWLNEGRMHWIEETVFSGFPMTYEMTAVWPASLSSDRLDQISVLQVFQMSILLAALFRGLRLMGIRKQLRVPLSIIVMLCSMLVYWCSLAKTDTLALLFITLALCSAVREREKPVLSGLSSWFFMGMALATKQTVVITLLPFILIKASTFFRSGNRYRVLALMFLAAVPTVFAVRTLIKTGSPTYPVYHISSLVNDEWYLLPTPDEIVALNDRTSEIHEESSYSFVKNVALFFSGMEGIFLLLLVAIIYSFRDFRKSCFYLAPIGIFSAVAVYVFWPPWWGAKYTVPIYPFIALISVFLIQDKFRSATWLVSGISVVSFVLPLAMVGTRDSVYPLEYRLIVSKAVATGEWDGVSGYKYAAATPEALTYMWLNSAYDEELKILSIHQEKRYFCDHQIYVGWRHPATQELYLDNTLEEECAILDSLGIDMVTFFRINPGPLDMENRLEILNHIGTGDILEPMIAVSGSYCVCRYNSPPDQL